MITWNQMDSVRSSPMNVLVKSQSKDDKLKLKDLYQLYLDYCQKDRNKNFEKKPGLESSWREWGIKLTIRRRMGTRSTYLMFSSWIRICEK